MWTTVGGIGLSSRIRGFYSRPWALASAHSIFQWLTNPHKGENLGEHLTKTVKIHSQGAYVGIKIYVVPQFVCVSVFT